MHLRNFVFLVTFFATITAMTLFAEADDTHVIEEHIKSNALSTTEEPENISRKTQALLSPSHRRHHHLRYHGHRRNHWRDHRNHRLTLNHTPHMRHRCRYHPRHQHTTFSQHSPIIINVPSESTSHEVKTPAKPQVPIVNQLHEEKFSDKNDRVKPKIGFESKENNKLGVVVDPTTNSPLTAPDDDLLFDIDIRSF